jgi:hypothetical protein
VRLCSGWLAVYPPCSLVAKDGSGFGLTMRKIGGGAVFCLDRNGDGGSGVRSGRCLFYRGG